MPPNISSQPFPKFLFRSCSNFLSILLTNNLKFIKVKIIAANMNNDHNEDLHLICQLREGEIDAYLKLYNKYHPLLYSYVLRFVKIPELAEDVLQEVFIKIWEIRQRINPDLPFNSYIYRISRNKVFKLVKKIGTDKALQVHIKYQLTNIVEGEELKLQWKQYDQLLHAAIDNLPPQRQKVFKLCRVDSKKYEEVADELGISRNTVKEHMVLAIKSIKHYFYQHADIQLTIIPFIFIYPAII